jgi:hypothetical protein
MVPGEAVNPLLRKIRDGLNELGLPTDELLRHGSPRLVYGVRLVENVREYLLGIDKRPRYLLPHRNAAAVTCEIIRSCRERRLLPPETRFLRETGFLTASPGTRWSTPSATAPACRCRQRISSSRSCLMSESTGPVRRSRSVFVPQSSSFVTSVSRRAHRTLSTAVPLPRGGWWAME